MKDLVAESFQEAGRFRFAPVAELLTSTSGGLQKSREPAKHRDAAL